MIRLLTLGKRFVPAIARIYIHGVHVGLFASAFSIPRGLYFIDGLRRFTLVRADRIQFLRPRLVSGMCSQQIDFLLF